MENFTSVDPLADKMPGWSPYAYTFNNPIRFIDPDGRMPKQNGGPDDPPDGIWGTLLSSVSNQWQSFKDEVFGAGDGPSFSEFLNTTTNAISNWTGAWGTIGENIIDEVPVAGELASMYKGEYSGVVVGLVPGGKKLKKAIEKATDLPVIQKGTKAWDEAVSILKNNDKNKINVRVSSASDAQELLNQSRGNMNRYKQYSKDKGTTYSKGYEVHNQQNSREVGAGNNLQHIKWKDGKSGGHIFYDKPN